MTDENKDIPLKYMKYIQLWPLKFLVYIIFDTLFISQYSLGNPFFFSIVISIVINYYY